MPSMGRIMIISITMISALACTGCTAFVAEERPIVAYSDAVLIETTQNMRLASPVVPAQLQLTTNTDDAEPEPERRLAPGLVSVGDSVERARNTLVEYGVAVPPVYDSEALFGWSEPTFAAVPPLNAGSSSETLLSGFHTDFLDLDNWSASPGLIGLKSQLGLQRLAFGTLDQQRYDAEFSFSAPRETTGLNFDIGVVPSASYAQEGDFTVRRVGAEFRLGRDIDQRGNNAGLPSWYLFAGADGEAVIFNNSSAGRGLGIVNGIQLRDQVTVGDIQAGINVRRYGTNFAFNYVRREVEYDLNSQETIRRSEDFGGITLSWRR